MTLPALPKRCLADAWDILTVTNCDATTLLLSASSNSNNDDWRSRPLSITICTSGIVTLVSAMLVANIIFGPLSNALDWSCDETDECKYTMRSDLSKAEFSLSILCTFRISSIPGKKHNSEFATMRPSRTNCAINSAAVRHNISSNPSPLERRCNSGLTRFCGTGNDFSPKCTTSTGKRCASGTSTTDIEVFLSSERK